MKINHCFLSYFAKKNCQGNYCFANSLSIEQWTANRVANQITAFAIILQQNISAFCLKMPSLFQLLWLSLCVKTETVKARHCKNPEER